MIIYKVTSKTSNKSYIGQTTKRLDDRKHAHFKNVKAGIKTKFYNAIRKYGESDFVWEIIDNAESKELLNKLETKYISKYDTYKTGYNMTLGGDGGDTISMKSDVEKKNQGAKLGNIPWNKGKSMKALGYDFFKDRTPRSFTDEQKRKHSDSIKSSEKYRNGLKNRRPAKQIVIKDEFGNVWNTQKDFRNEFKLSYYKTKQILSGELLNGVSYSIVSKK